MPQNVIKYVLNSCLHVRICLYAWQIFAATTEKKKNLPVRWWVDYILSHL